MAETSDQIELHIERTRADLSENISELQDKVRTALDWRAQFNERPFLLMGLAFSGGVLLSALLPSPRGKAYFRRFRYSSDPDTVNDGLRRARTGYDKRSGPAAETWNALKGAIAGVAANKIGEYVNEYVPGFHEEYSQRRANPAQRYGTGAFGAYRQGTGSVRGDD
jgi:hypothetical protein